MFGLSNRKQEKKDREQELASCQAALAQAEHALGEMGLIWVNAEQKLSEIEKQQRELERQLKQTALAASYVSGESGQQEERNQKLLAEAEKMARKQKVLRIEQQRVWDESGDREGEELVDLTRMVAPVTVELSQGMEEMRNMLEEVLELGRKMGVISLNAAVEAGRMGEPGEKFVQAAEEMRDLSKQYQQATSSLAQQMQAVGLKWQKSKDEIGKAEQRLKQQHARLQAARKACEAVGNEMLRLPVEELHDEMEQTFANEAMRERCEDVSGKIEKAQQDFAKQQESYGGLRQTVSRAKALIKNMQG